jgi:hypothetical protein
MGLGQLAIVDNTLESEPGETVNFPYYKNIGAVQKPAEDEGLSVDRLQDDAFSCTVYEVGKAVGWKDKNKRKSAQKAPEDEAMRQLGERFAENLDGELIELINVDGNYVQALTSADGTDTLTIQKLLNHNITAFGDKSEKTIAYAMHSFHWLDIMSAGGSGFLVKTDNDPFNGLPGFKGRILNCALFVLDTLPRLTDIGAKKTYPVFSFKAQPFGVYKANDLQVERDRDILHRENIIAATMWYGLCSLHAKVHANDLRVARSSFATSKAA